MRIRIKPKEGNVMGKQKFIVSAKPPELLDQILVKAIRTRLRFYDAVAARWRNPSKKSKRVGNKIELTFESTNSEASSILRNFTDDLNRGRADVEVTYILPLPLSRVA
jgi:hypothetical protein